MNAKQYNVEITTSPDFIQMMGRKLYTNPLVAILVRELLQNSRDATSYPYKGRIDLTIEMGSSFDMTKVVCADTGCGMDEDTLVNTFLQIGGSKKVDGSVGGFGVAKVSIFATGDWSVHTQNNYVDNTLLYKQINNRKGTVVHATVTHRNDWIRSSEVDLATLFVKSSNVQNVWLNGEKIKAYKPRKVLDIFRGAVISTAPKLMGLTNKIFYRIRGLTQYVDSLGYGDDYGFNVLVDFDAIGYKPKDDNYPFDAAREKCKSIYTDAVRGIVAPLAKNVLTARKEHGYDHKPARERIQHRAKSSEKAYIVVNAPKKVETVDRVILQTWREICEAVGRRSVEVFSYGLTYDGDTVAEYRSENGRKYLLINPELVRRDWNMAEYNPKTCVPFIWTLWHTAVHEMTHALGHSDHDEEFTSAEGRLARETSMYLAEILDPLRAQARKTLREIIKAEQKL